ncbi:unnamed protein product [Rotaria magnacalcarata]|uniref:Transmembrane protein 144 n=1 Tax=Rotaria magnacalcarata TaxID=392030 RepID=A0A816N002_9BILA|nr:unnamed protein product [Rotaria magnacalcarata]
MRGSRIAYTLIVICTLSSIINVISDDVIDKVADKSINKTLIRAVAETESQMPVWVGFVGCLVASVFFGSNLLPVKQFSAGDGFFFQFVFCVVVWLVGLIVDLILNNQRFYPLVLLGGVLWTTGNLVTVFCIKTCGLAVGLLIWGTTSLVVGWAGGRFGIFGLAPQVPTTSSKLAMNYASVVLAALSGVFFLFIKSTKAPRDVQSVNTIEDHSSINLDKVGNNDTENDEYIDTDFPFLNRLSDRIQQILGCGLAALAGVFYGLMFIPDQYIRDHRQDFKYRDQLPPNNGLYYINSQYSGILLSSLFYFVVYAALKRNKPRINPSIALPAMVSGAMWAVANIGFIVAITALKNAVAYPIVNVLPGVVTSLWSLFLFREIQGMKNYIYLGIGMLIRILAAVFSGLSA